MARKVRKVRKVASGINTDANIVRKKKLVFFTGSGVSAESGVDTFREEGGIWDKFTIEKYATLEAWSNNKADMLAFYNNFRTELSKLEPNAAHNAIMSLETDYDVTIVTQNCDDFHERAGSTKVIHIHGNLTTMRSSLNNKKILPYTEDILLGDIGNDGSQMRPNVVWFGENLIDYDKAKKAIESADIFVIIGTSLEVYPAEGLVYLTKENTPKFIIDIKFPEVRLENIMRIEKPATEGMLDLIDALKILD